MHTTPNIAGSEKRHITISINEFFLEQMQIFWHVNICPISYLNGMKQMFPVQKTINNIQQYFNLKNVKQGLCQISRCDNVTEKKSMNTNLLMKIIGNII